MLEHLKGAVSLFLKSGVYVSFLAVLLFIVAQSFGSFAPPYVIAVSTYSDGLNGAKCSSEKLSLLREEIRSSAHKYISEANSIKAKEYDPSSNFLITEGSESLSSALFDGNVFYEMISELRGDREKKINIFVKMEDGGCVARGAVVIYKNERKFIPVDADGDIGPIAVEVVNVVDDFIPTAMLAQSYNTAAEVRRRSFLAIAQGRQLKWYMNLVGYTYLEEASIFDRNVNSSIVLGRFDRASYWIDKALSLDKDFLPAIFNKIYIDIERNKHSSDAYDGSIALLMGIHYRKECGECLSRVARLRIERYERMAAQMKMYAEMTKDIPLARSIIEYKIENYGSSPEDTINLYRAVTYLERGEYFEFLRSATEQYNVVLNAGRNGGR